MTIVNGRAVFSSFEESTAEDWAFIAPQLNVTQSFVPDRVMDLLRAMKSDHGGFPVDRLEHVLQTATRAERDGRDEEYVLCALIHDIGDTLSPFDHPAVGAAILKPFVSEANHWMVEKHGIFQGYFFFHHIGLDRNAREEFRGHPWFERTALFCERYDGPAFDPTLEVMPLEAFEPMLRRLFAAPRQSIYKGGLTAP